MAGLRVWPGAASRLPYSAAGEAGLRLYGDRWLRDKPVFHDPRVAGEGCGKRGAAILTADAARPPDHSETRLSVATPAVTGASPTRFAHDSEAELARIFDYYRIEWRYEPDTFAIAWNVAGAVVERFTPDFYLPEIDLYIELTTLKQGLVRKKNRKVRILRQLYPGLRIKLFYARDFKALMLKYGRASVFGNGRLPGQLDEPAP